MAPSITSNRLFGAAGERIRPGYPDTEWSVWITGMDEIHDRPTLAAALQHAVELNAAFADLVSRDENAPTLHAVVLHWGFAWTQKTEHGHGRDCGIEECGPCGGPGRDMHRRPVENKGGAR